MKAGIYSRISTCDQQTIEMQLEACRNYIKSRGWMIAIEESEIASGSKNDRIKRTRLMTAAKKRELDVIVVWKLDRWGRSTLDLLNSLQELKELGVSFVSITEALDFTTSAGKALVGMLAIFADFEKDLIKERIRAGIKQAREKGAAHGRPPKILFLKSKIIDLKNQGKNYTEIAAHLKISRGSVYNILPAPKKERLVPKENFLF